MMYSIATWATAMANANPFTVEVQFVPLPESAAEERKRRLRSLLLRGALRVVQHQFPAKPEAEILESVKA